MSVNNLGSLLQSLPNSTLASLLTNSSASNEASSNNTATDAKTQAVLSMETFLANDPLLQDSSTADKHSNSPDPLIALAEQAALMPTYNALGLVESPNGSVPGTVNTTG